jgi:hypothetical protein
MLITAETRIAAAGAVAVSNFNLVSIERCRPA